MISMMAFIPIFFFASEYAQIALHKTASEAGIFLLFFFLGFVVAAQIGGRMLDREGAKRAVVARVRHRRRRLRHLGLQGDDARASASSRSGSSWPEPAWA